MFEHGQGRREGRFLHWKLEEGVFLVSKRDMKVRECCLAGWVSLGFITRGDITWLRAWVFPFTAVADVCAELYLELSSKR